jgi:adenylate cyclase
MPSLRQTVAGYSKLAGVDEERTLARLRALRSDLIDPTVALHHGRVFKRTGDGVLIEFRSVVDAVRCAIEVQNGMVERNAGVPPERRIEFRVGIHLGDVVEESDGDLMGDGRQYCRAIGRHRQVWLDLSVRRRLSDGEVAARCRHERSWPDRTQEHREAIRVYSLEVGRPAQVTLPSASTPGSLSSSSLSLWKRKKIFASGVERGGQAKRKSGSKPRRYWPTVSKCERLL